MSWTWWPALNAACACPVGAIEQRACQRVPHAVAVENPRRK